MSYGRPGARFIGVELDSISGRIARALHPEHDIRIESFRDTNLPEGRIDAVIGNVPFADLKLDYRGQKLSLHDFFFAKSIDALKPGGILALVTICITRSTSRMPPFREYLASNSRFRQGGPPAFRRPSSAEGHRRGHGHPVPAASARQEKPANHADPDWLGNCPDLSIEGEEVPVNRYFLNHPEMVLSLLDPPGHALRRRGLQRPIGNGRRPRQLKEAIHRLPEFAPLQASPVENEPAPRFAPPPPSRAPYRRR